MSLSVKHYKDALAVKHYEDALGPKTRPAKDLGQLIRDRQDFFRGRPRNWRDDFSDWWRHIDWGFVGFVVCVIAWGACQMIIAVAKLESLPT